MKMSSTIKVAVVATALVAIGKVIYDKVKACNDDTIETAESNDVETVETEAAPTIVNKVIDKYNGLSEQKKAVILVGGAAVAIGGLMVCGHHMRIGHGKYAFIKSAKEYMNSQDYANARDKAWDKYVSSPKFQEDTERLLNSLIPRSFDEYITSFMKKDLVNDPETYQYYLDNKLNTDLWYTCIFCKVLDSGLISLDQFKEACDSARADIFQLTEQEV